jgi:hypothetical protein
MFADKFRELGLMNAECYQIYEVEGRLEDRL